MNQNYHDAQREYDEGKAGWEENVSMQSKNAAYNDLLDLDGG